MVFFNLDECRKDLVILIDASNSIGKGNFKEYVRPFLKNLVKSPKLDVGPQGTRIAFVTFSNESRTKYRLKFGDRTREDYETFINNTLRWDVVSGGQTYTGMALGIVDNEVILFL